MSAPSWMWALYDNAFTEHFIRRRDTVLVFHIRKWKQIQSNTKHFVLYTGITFFILKEFLFYFLDFCNSVLTYFSYDPILYVYNLRRWQTILPNKKIIFSQSLSVFSHCAGPAYVLYVLYCYEFSLTFEVKKMFLRLEIN